MRIGTQYQFQAQSDRVARAQERMFEAQTRVVTGKRVQKMSDDPVVAARGIDLRRAVGQAEQYRANLGEASTRLKESENALASANHDLRRAYEIAVRGANATLDPATREGLLSELTSIRDRLLSHANAQNAQGDYLFSGRALDVRPFVMGEDGVAYQGGEGMIMVQSGPGETVEANVAGRDLFLNAFAALGKIEEGLRSGNPKQVGNDGIPAIQSSLDAFTRARGDIGARLQRIDETSAIHQRRIDDFVRSISDGEDADLAQALVEFQSAELAYTAALQVAARGLRLSLLDFVGG